MPLLVSNHPHARPVIAVRRDKVSIRDIEDYLNTAMANDLLAYAKLVDFSDRKLALSESEMLSLGAWIKAYASAGLKLGPLALVVRSKDRPIKLFSKALSARTWLDKMNGTG